MSRHLLCLAALLSAASVAAAQDAPPAGGADRVGEIRVQGNQRLSDQAVLANVRTRTGEVYDDALARADQQRLLATGQFSNVVVRKTQSDQGVILTFVVEERPTVRALEFVGNKAFDDKELRKTVEFGVGSPLQPYLLDRKGRSQIEQHYHEKGYYFAQVTFDANQAQTDGRVVYDIVEGPKVHIRTIRFEGNDYFSDFGLKWKIRTQARFWPFVPGTLDREQLQQDVHTIRNEYVREGYLDAEVDATLEFSADKAIVTVTFVIQEGPRYRIDAIRFEGNRAFSGEELAGRLELEVGDFYVLQEVQRAVSRVQDTYGELGYIQAAVDVARRFKETPGVVDMVFRVVEHDQYTIGKIIIRGNENTQERVIRRELLFYPEQVFDMVRVKQAQRRLQEARLFSDVTISPVGNEPNVRDALVQVTPGPTANFLIGVGVTSQSGLVGTVSLEQRNFDILGWPRSWRDIADARAWKGAGQTLRLTAEPGTELMRFYIDWQEPYLFDQPYALGTRVFLFTRQREQYDETRYGGVFSLGHRFKSRWYLEFAPRAEGVELDDFDDDTAQEILDYAGTHALLGLKTTLTRNMTDSRWLPSQGDVLRISVEPVVGDYPFTELYGEYAIYHTLYTDALDRKHILSGRVSAGHLFGDAPLYERYYGGGLGSVRGFEFRGISPRAKGTDQRIGGSFMAFAGAEYTFPLISDVIRGVVFLDSGTVEPDVGINTWRSAAGVGIRWVIPFFGPVPFSFNFGFPLSKDEQDDTQIFSFSFGWTF